MKLMHYPDGYTAAVPVCEAYNNAWITDTMPGNIKDKPLFFIYSKDDAVVPPADNEIPVIARLQAMAAILPSGTGWRHRLNNHFFGGYLEITFYSSAVF